MSATLIDLAVIEFSLPAMGFFDSINSAIVHCFFDSYSIVQGMSSSENFLVAEAQLVLDQVCSMPFVISFIVNNSNRKGKKRQNA